MGSVSEEEKTTERGDPEKEEDKAWSSRIKRRIYGGPCQRADMGGEWLRARLSMFKHEVNVLAEEVRQKKADQDPELFWVSECKQLLQQSQEELNEGCIETGWRLLHTAERVSYQGLKTFDQTTPRGVVNPRIETRAEMLREKASTDLVGWRRRSVEALLAAEGDTDRRTPDVDAPDEALLAAKDATHRRVPTVDELSEAHRLVHESHENVHMLRRYLQKQFNQLIIQGLAAGILFVGLAMVAELDTGGLVSPFDATPDQMNSAGFAVFVILAGIFGASIFGMRSLRQQPLSTKLPQNIQSINITRARGVAGGIAALLFYFLLKAGFISVGTLTPAVYIAVGFAAGYSERMVSAAVKRVAAITEKAESGEES